MENTTFLHTRFERVRLQPALALLLSLLLLISCRQEPPAIPQEDIQALSGHLDTHRPLPSQLLSGELAGGRSAAFVPGSVLRADSIRLMETLLPSLYDAGLRHMGVFFLSGDFQAETDRLILPDRPVRPPESESADAESPDAKPEVAPDTQEMNTRAEKLLRLSDSSLGYTEYRDFLVYAARFNRLLPPEEEPLHIWAINQFSETGGALAEKLKADAELPKETVLLLWLDARENPDTDGLVSVGHFFSDGLIDTVLSSRDIRDRSFSFRPGEAPWTEWPDTLKNLPERDVVIVSFFPVTPVTPIPEFVEEGNAAEAIASFPGEISGHSSAAQSRKMNKIITKAAAKYRKTLEKTAGRNQP